MKQPADAASNMELQSRNILPVCLGVVGRMKVAHCRGGSALRLSLSRSSMLKRYAFAGVLSLPDLSQDLKPRSLR
jgi:hypothetical protein